MSIDREQSAATVSLDTDVRVVGVELYWLPIETRVPLKFGAETLTSVTCARVGLTVATRNGRPVRGWGETPLSVQWAWPSSARYALRHTAMKQFCCELAQAWADYRVAGHAIEIGYAFQRDLLPSLLARFNQSRPKAERLPYLAALVCCSLFDVALHDAYGQAQQLPVYETYGAEFLRHDLSYYLTPAPGASVDFRGRFPDDFLVRPRTQRLAAWHLVGGLDPLEPDDVETPIDDGHPQLLSDWIRTDGLRCLKIKLRGTDAEWDYQRLVRVGQIAIEQNVESLTADFNCTVTDPEYVIEILRCLSREQAEIYRRLLYVEQPFPYELDEHLIDVRGLASLKPLLMDESAHDWQHVKLGQSLGWNGVALKTCKTQTGALLAMCWARAHGMHLMVQDLTNPMLAQIPHLLLAAHSPTMKGVETNSMQFYPDASACEAVVHPNIYRRRQGQVDLSSLQGAGFGYRVDEIARELPAPVFRARHD